MTIALAIPFWIDGIADKGKVWRHARTVGLRSLPSSRPDTRPKKQFNLSQVIGDEGDGLHPRPALKGDDQLGPVGRGNPAAPPVAAPFQPAGPPSLLRSRRKSNKHHSIFGLQDAHLHGITRLSCVHRRCVEEHAGEGTR